MEAPDEGPVFPPRAGKRNVLSPRAAPHVVHALSAVSLSCVSLSIREKQSHWVIKEPSGPPLEAGHGHLPRLVSVTAPTPAGSRGRHWQGQQPSLWLGSCSST